MKNKIGIVFMFVLFCFVPAFCNAKVNDHNIQNVEIKEEELPNESNEFGDYCIKDEYFFNMNYNWLYLYNFKTKEMFKYEIENGEFTYLLEFGENFIASVALDSGAMLIELDNHLNVLNSLNYNDRFDVHTTNDYLFVPSFNNVEIYNKKFELVKTIDAKCSIFSEFLYNDDYAFLEVNTDSDSSEIISINLHNLDWEIKELNFPANDYFYIDDNVVVFLKFDDLHLYFCDMDLNVLGEVYVGEDVLKDYDNFNNFEMFYENGNYYVPLKNETKGYLDAVKIDKSYNTEVVSNPHFDLANNMDDLYFYLTKGDKYRGTRPIKIADDRYLYMSYDFKKLYLNVYSLKEGKDVYHETFDTSKFIYNIFMDQYDDYYVLYYTKDHSCFFIFFDKDLKVVKKIEKNYNGGEDASFQRIFGLLPNKTGFSVFVDYCPVDHELCAVPYNRFKYDFVFHYKASVVDSLGGAIKLSSKDYKAGDLVKLDILLEDGYELKNLKVLDSLNNEVYVKGESFIMPDSDVTISGEFVKSIDNPNTRDSIIMIVLSSLIAIFMGCHFYTKKKRLE